MRLLVVAGVLCGALVAPLSAWDHPGHAIVNELALASLPDDFPAFVREPANVARISFLAGEPDRWSHALDIPLKHYQWPDHYLDVEQLPAAGLDVATISSFRYDFMQAFDRGRTAHPENFQKADPINVAIHVEQWPGFLPWAITEYYGKLTAAFASFKVYEELGTPEEVANARANVIYIMGTMGHFVGDCAEPLHTTIHHAGWSGANPAGYTTETTIHTWIDSGLITKAGIKLADVRSRIAPAQVISLAVRPDGRDPVFVAQVDFIVAQNKFVEPLYQLEKAGKLGRGAVPVSDEGRAFIEGQLVKGGQMLGAVWLTAWRATRPDTYLRGVLLRRQAAAAPRVDTGSAPQKVP